jgi:inorganic triphosphatase YgiF
MPKMPARLTRRPEWNIQVTGNRPDLNVLPVEARACLGDIQADDLQPCFSTEFTRTAWHLEDEDGARNLPTIRARCAAVR